MRRKNVFSLFAMLCLIWTAFFLPSTSKADAVFEPPAAGTAYDLINGVNALRASYGLAPYSINPILMYTAQAQADFMAANTTVTHSGPGGIGVTDRLLVAGYPLAGDLSLGGFRSENITGGSESMSAQTAVDQWTGDAPHLTTMISPDLTEIGAGVAVAGGRVYYVIDCARPTTAGASQSPITPVGGGTTVPGAEAPAEPIQVVMVNTPNVDGNVIHEVKYGQTLWQIAITYETRIDEIKQLNNLSGNDIYPGQKLLIKMGVLVPTLTSTFMTTETMTPEAAVSTSTFVVESPVATFISATSATSSPVATVTVSNNSMTTNIVIGIITLALLGGGVITWMGTKKGDD